MTFGSHDSRSACASGGPVGEDRAVMIAVPALGIEPAALRDRFEQRGLAAAVFADEERDLAAKRQIDPVREGADVERIAGRIDLLRQARDSVEERRAQACPGATARRFDFMGQLSHGRVNFNVCPSCQQKRPTSRTRSRAALCVYRLAVAPLRTVDGARPQLAVPSGSKIPE